MSKADVVSIFDHDRAAKYDAQATLFGWRNTFNEFVLHIFSQLPEDATILCVGVGTGLELLPLALAEPSWRFLALEPASAMLEVCRQKAETAGVSERCEFFHGYLEDLPADRIFDAATCLLVSHFLTEPGAREQFFRDIASHLRPGGVYINGDLAGDQDTPQYAAAEELWFRGMAAAQMPVEQMEGMRTAYRTMVNMRSPREVEALLEAAGFITPMQFYQALLIHGWFAIRGA